MTHYLCEVDEVTASGKEVCLQSESGLTYIMLFQHAGSIRAFLNVCPHQGQSLNWAPDQFLFTPDKLLVCAQHGATFELATGNCVDGPCRGAKLQAVNIRIEDRGIWLEQETA